MCEKVSRQIVSDIHIVKAQLEQKQIQQRKSIAKVLLMWILWMNPKKSSFSSFFISSLHCDLRLWMFDTLRHLSSAQWTNEREKNERMKKNFSFLYFHTPQRRAAKQRDIRLPKESCARENEQNLSHKRIFFFYAIAVFYEWKLNVWETESVR